MEPSLIEYTLRDPLLFGDFRNACYEDEPRYYEDLLDYEAVYNLLLEVFKTFSTSPQWKFISPLYTPSYYLPTMMM